MTDSDVSQSYVTEVTYPHTFFGELSPAWLNYAAALNGVTPRNLDDPFTYLELGSGFGRSAVTHAGAFPHGLFHACDFNPVHIEGGRRHAANLGISNIEFHQSSFEELLSNELPSFDFIALHGVYSWVGLAARQGIRELIRRRLKSGGLVYVSYNALPGWAVEVPLRKLLVELATTTGDTAERTHEALQSLRRLSDSRLRYFSSNPAAVAAVDSYARASGSYIAHEFLNQTWEPFFSIDVADDMAEAGVTYVGSATLAENHPALLLESRAAEAISTLRTARQQQLAIDFAVNQRFRRDIFVRSDGRLSSDETRRHVSALAIGRIGLPDRISARARVPRGDVIFQDDFMRDLRALMSRGSVTIGDAIVALGGTGGADEIVRNLMFLVAAGELTPFAKAFRRQKANVGRIASPMLTRLLSHVIGQQVPLTLPSEILGNGIRIGPSDAATIAEWLERAEQKEVPEIVSTLISLGLIR